MCCGHIASIKLAILAGGIYFFVSEKTEQTGLTWCWQREAYRIYTLLEAWYFHMTHVYLILFPINSGYGPPSFSPSQISHIDTHAMMDHFSVCSQNIVTISLVMSVSSHLQTWVPWLSRLSVFLWLLCLCQYMGSSLSNALNIKIIYAF
jgi:hypothetical protein